MANPHAGEVALAVGGEQRVAKLTLGTLAELETALEAGSLLALVERFEGGTFSARDVLLVLAAGLRGGGWQGTAADLVRADMGLAPVAAARAAAALLARAFAVPE